MAIGHGRDPSSWVFYIILFHAMLYLLLVVNAFQGTTSIATSPSNWAISDLLAFFSFGGGEGTFWGLLTTAGISISILAITSIVSGKITYGIVFGILGGLFITVWGKVGTIFAEVISTAGDYGNIVIAITVILGTAFAFVTINAILQTIAPTRYGG